MPGAREVVPIGERPGDDRHRRQGLALAVFDSLMGWFAASGVKRVDLHASTMGEPLYRSYGFADPRQPELRWRAHT